MQNTNVYTQHNTENQNKPNIRAVAVVYICMFLEGAGSILIASTKSSLMEHFGIGIASIGMVLTVYSLFCGLFPMLFGGLSDKYGRKIIISLGLVLFIIFYFLVPLTNIFSVLVLLTAVLGIGYCCVDPSAQAILFDSYKDATPKMPLVQLAFASGAVTAPILIGAIYDYNVSWKTAYIFYGTAFILLLIFVQTVAFPKTANKNTDAESSRTSAFSAEPKPLREGLGICIFMICSSLATGILSRWADVYMTEVFNYSNSSAVKILGIYQIGCIAGAVMNLYLSGKIHVTKLLIIYPFAAFFTMLGGIIIGSSFIFTIALFITGTVSGTLFSLSVGLMGQLFWKNTGAATGFISSSSGIGLALSSAITGKMIEVTNVVNVFILMLVLTAVSGFTGLIIRRMYLKLFK